MKVSMTLVIKTKILKMTKIFKIKETFKKIRMVTRWKIFCKNKNKKQDKTGQSY